jgi:hypothetical protein
VLQSRVCLTMKAMFLLLLSLLSSFWRSRRYEERRCLQSPANWRSRCIVSACYPTCTGRSRSRYRCLYEEESRRRLSSSPNATAVCLVVDGRATVSKLNGMRFSVQETGDQGAKKYSLRRERGASASIEK